LKRSSGAEVFSATLRLREKKESVASVPFVPVVSVISAVAHTPSPVDEFTVTCPYCGEQVEIYLEPDVRGSFVQDCEVCCNPWRIRVKGKGDDRSVDVTRADGSE